MSSYSLNKAKENNMSAYYPHSLIPPHILRRIIDNGSEAQQHFARRTLVHVQNLMDIGLKGISKPLTTYPGELMRNIYDAHHQSTVNGTLVRYEGQPSNGDIAADEAYEYLGVTHDFFWRVWRRNSLDNQGMALNGIVHFGESYMNAFWDGQEMVFGDGDGVIFNRFTIAIDVIAHELGHGVTGSEAGLIYYAQSGALNESLSDVFGSLVKQYYYQQTADQADWLIGEGLLGERINGRALRSMSAPGTAYNDPMLGADPQPAHMNDYVRTRDDNGGVHLNSGIPNRAFYLASVAVGGYAWEKTGYAWYDTVCDKSLTPDADFATFARLTIYHGGKRSGKAVANAIEQAWREVGVLW